MFLVCSEANLEEVARAFDAKASWVNPAEEMAFYRNDLRTFGSSKAPGTACGSSNQVSMYDGSSPN